MTDRETLLSLIVIAQGIAGIAVTLRYGYWKNRYSVLEHRYYGAKRLAKEWEAEYVAMKGVADEYRDAYEKDVVKKH